jgi:hypothetical protein
MRDEKNTEDAMNEGSNQQATPLEVEIQREIQRIGDITHRYIGYLEVSS